MACSTGPFAAAINVGAAALMLMPLANVVVSSLKASLATEALQGSLLISTAFKERSASG